MQKTFADSDNSWSIDIADTNQTTFDLSVKTLNKKEEITIRKPKDILAEIHALDKQSAEILKSIMEILK